MNFWVSALIELLCYLLIATLVSVVWGHFFIWAFVALLILLGHQYWQLSLLIKRLDAHKLKDKSNAKGVWHWVYFYLDRVHRRHRQTKKRLGKLLNQFYKSTATLPDAAIVLNVDDEIEWFNDSARELVGLRKKNLGTHIARVIDHPLLTAYLSSEDLGETAVITSPVNKGVFLEFRFLVYNNELRLLLAQDVTKLKNSEDMRRDFVANVSHELRTPLTVIKGYLETLQDMDEEVSEFLTDSYSRMIQQTARMEGLIEDLLLLARLECITEDKGDLETLELVDVSAVLKQLCFSGDAFDPLNARINLSIESALKIRGKEKDLESVFTNLIVNAMKYSDEDSKIDVRWQSVPRGVKFEVQDYGDGIAKEHIHRLTERFYRVDVGRSREKGGTGLGLAIAKHVLANHDSKLLISSQEGVGSSFSCIFPHTRCC
ncbi:MAG: phosphate regulon sensor histidine kinase PhoR [Methylococcales bacterium]|jgi:two-component system phosphate regulon sensor histidine kinase PhoR|nr:phosphate regulon sensor histidine kinase PhoR [Methylococcales bacterium]